MVLAASPPWSSAPWSTSPGSPGASLPGGVLVLGSPGGGLDARSAALVRASLAESMEGIGTADVDSPESPDTGT